MQPYEREMKGIKLLQERSASVTEAHRNIGNDLEHLKRQLQNMDAQDFESPEFAALRRGRLDAAHLEVPLPAVAPDTVYAEAERCLPGGMDLRDILSAEDFEEAHNRVDRRVLDFNRRHSLDAWDYAIAGSCGLFAAMLDLLCVAAPVSSGRTAFSQPLDGIFNRACQKTFNAIFPPEYSAELSKAFVIGAPDSSTQRQLLRVPEQAFGPLSHRFRSLAHDPVLGFFFGVRDMLHNTCTMVDNGRIVSLPSAQAPVQVQGVFQGLGRMLGHLASDFNAPSAGGNRGMGLPAPFMGLLSMFDIPFPDSEFGRLLSDVQGTQGMYLRGYDLRHFIVTSIPLAIMEVMLRTTYAVKQVKTGQAGFAETLKDTLPVRMHPRFRMITTLAYGTFCAVNAGKVHVTQNMLQANYAAWMGLTWNSFHALKWALLDRPLALWDDVAAIEIAELESLVQKLDALEARAAFLPI